MGKIVAYSYERYNGGVAVKRLYGSSCASYTARLVRATAEVRA